MNLDWNLEKLRTMFLLVLHRRTYEKSSKNKIRFDRLHVVHKVQGKLIKLLGFTCYSRYRMENVRVNNIGEQRMNNEAIYNNYA